MVAIALRWAILVGAALPLCYYLLAIYGARRFFRERLKIAPDFVPPVSILKPVRGLDREAYENFASFCRQDYSEYEILFAVADGDDPVIPVIRKVIEDFPERRIQLLVGVEDVGTNSKVCKLCRLVRQARYDLLVMSDSDVRVRPDYLRAVVAPFRDPRVGAITCPYRGVTAGQFSSNLECVGATSDFFAGAMVARQLEGIKFALGATMATTRARLAEIGGFEALLEHHSDDFELGNRIAARGYRVELVPYTVTIIFPAQTLRSYLRHELRWAIGMRHIRPWGHLGMVFTHGLPWSLATFAVAPAVVALGYLGAYLLARLAMAWTVGVWGLKDDLLRRKLWLVPLRDALSFLVWLASFTSNRIQWRGAEFYVRKGRLVPAEKFTRPSTAEPLGRREHDSLSSRPASR